MKIKRIFLILLMLFALLLNGCREKPIGEQPIKEEQNAEEQNAEEQNAEEQNAEEQNNEEPITENSIGEPVEINISAAASLMDALTEIQVEYARESNVVLLFNFASSGTLQKQIQEGAPCDLYISASKAHMDTLEEAGLIDTDSRKVLLENALTLISSKEKADVITGIESLTSEGVASISIGTPESVPAGKYAEQTLENLNILDQIQGKIVYAKDVRQVLEYVETGNVDCGLVYKTDALLLETGVAIGDMSEDSHDPIVYPIALIKNTAVRDAVTAFYDFLQTDYAKQVFENYGFTIPKQ